MSVNRKKRVLFCGEASYLATGFSTYWYEVLKRIHATGEIELAEMGSYANDGDPRNSQMPWKFYPVGPHPQNKQAMAVYNSRITNQFGEAKLPEVCLDFQPDIICGLRDHWMDEHIDRTPFRRYFKWIEQPTVDGIPQRDLWVDTYKRCDKVLTYSQWGYDVIKDQGHGQIPLVTVASPGVDLDVFKPIGDKKTHKARSGIRPDSFIVGTVMRNQARKLYYDLIEAFAQFIRSLIKRGKLEQAKKTFLYLHTSYPDVGFDIGKAVKEFKISKHVMMTYYCANCNTVFPAFFSGEWTVCRNCKKVAAHPPNANHSLPREALAQIMNLFDVGVQYSICWEKGTPVYMSNGIYKPIEEINCGDQVMTHNGSQQTVTQIFESDPVEAVEIKIFGDYRTYRCTSNHPIWTKDRGWIRASQLRSPGSQTRINGDWVGQPIPKFSNTNIENFNPYLLGILLGDGWIGGRDRWGVSLGYNKKQAIQEVVKSLPSSYGKRDRNGTAIEFTWQDEQNLKLLSPCLSQGARHKSIPSWVFKCTDSYVANVLRGLFETDGHESKKDIRFYSSSEVMANQVRLLLAGFKIASTIVKHQRQSRKTLEFSVIVKGCQYLNRMQFIKLGQPPPINEKPPSTREVFTRIENDYLWCKIKSIKTTTIGGKVYNLEVENTEGGDAEHSHSYIVGSIACHNCEGYG